MLRNLMKNLKRAGDPGEISRTPPTAARLNLGCGTQHRAGWVNLDARPLPGVDVVADLDACADTPLPFADDSFDEFHASHLLEHLQHPLPFMQELHRIARPGALLEIRVPYGSSDDADLDPTHVRRYFVRSFKYFTQGAYRNFDYGYRGDWEPVRIDLIIDGARYAGVDDAEVLERIQSHRNVVQEMRAFLRAVKPAREPGVPPGAPPLVRLVRAAAAGAARPPNDAAA
jgi:SAM-dependent methyltransferase